MDAERFDAVLEPSHLDDSQPSGGLFSHALWSVFTALPVLSSIAWLLLAVRTRRGRYLANAIIYLLWPVVGLFFAALFVVVAGLESSTENETAFVAIVCAGMWLTSLVSAHREWKALGLSTDFDLFDDTPSDPSADPLHAFEPPRTFEPLAALETHSSVASHDEADQWIEDSLDHRQTEHPDLVENGRHESASSQGRSEEPEESDLGLYVLCYFLWLTLGWVGAHRFYSGRWVSGLFYACSFGFAGAGWAADLFLLNSMVDDLRRKERARRVQEASDSTINSAPTRAAWADSKSRFSWIDFALRFGFFLVGPFVFTLLCVLCKHYELLAVMFVVVVICGLLGNIDRALGHTATVEKVPMLGGALHVFKDLYAFYSTHKPRSFLFYLFYPISAPLAAVVSPRVREEMGLYWRVLRPILLVIAAHEVLTYSSIYPPHLGPQEAFVRVFVLAFFAAVLTTSFLIPMVTTSFALNLSGRQPQLKFLTFLCLALALPTGIYCYYEQTQQISFLSSDLLEERMNKASFRDELRESAEMFLTYYVNRIEDPDTETVAQHAGLTERFRRHIGGIIIDDEANGFVVFSVPGRHHTPDDMWLGVGVWYGFSDEPSDILVLMSPDKHLYTHWADLPHEIQCNFHLLNEWEETIDDAGQHPEIIATQSLIRDFH